VQLVLAGTLDEIAQHVDQARDRVVAPRLVVGMAPYLGCEDTGCREVGCLLEVELDDAGADIGAADIDRQDRVVPGKDPGRRDVSAADQPGLVRIMVDRFQLDAGALDLEPRRRSSDRDLADAARAKPAADGDALRALPALQPQEAGITARCGSSTARGWRRGRANAMAPSGTSSNGSCVDRQNRRGRSDIVPSSPHVALGSVVLPLSGAVRRLSTDL
jgi:hypothetical protein